MIILAHADGAHFGDFYAGLLHPLTSLEHLLPLLGLCLFAGLQPRAPRSILLAVPAGLLTGMLLHTAVGDQAWTLLFNLAALSLLGIGIAAAHRVSPPVLGLIGAALGITVGLQVGTGLPTTVSALPFGFGVAATGLLLAALAMTVAGTLRRGWTAIAVRVTGSWIAAAGIVLIGLQFIGR